MSVDWRERLAVHQDTAQLTKEARRKVMPQTMAIADAFWRQFGPLEEIYATEGGRTFHWKRGT